VAAAQFLMGMLFAEALYPGYSISGNYISDLGAFCNGGLLLGLLLGAQSRTTFPKPSRID